MSLQTNCALIFSAANEAQGVGDSARADLVSASEIENAVLQAAGLEQTGLASEEAETAIHAAPQQVVFKTDTGRIKVLFKPSGNVRLP